MLFSELSLLAQSTTILKCTKKLMRVPVQSWVAATATRIELTVTNERLTLTKFKLLAIQVLLRDSVALTRT